MFNYKNVYNMLFTTLELATVNVMSFSYYFVDYSQQVLAGILIL